MIQEKKNATNLGVAGGILLHIIGTVVQRQGDSLFFVGLAIILAGSAFFIWGCVNYAQGKGYPGVLGLLGLLSCLGLIILVVLPDKHPNG